VPTIRDVLYNNLQRVRQQIAEAAQASDRSADDVCLIGVTKYVDLEVTRTLLELGCQDLGESRPQQLWTKAESLAQHCPKWHMIGHLQRNKTKRTVPVLHTLHSGDSLRILEAINKEIAAEEQLSVLVEINISGDTNKHGLLPQDVASSLEQIAKLERLRVQGLMGMASLEGGRSQAQRDFAALRELRDSLLDQCPSNVSLRELSMGMSQDFDLAIREGATMVRVGSTLFEGIDDAT